MGCLKRLLRGCFVGLWGACPGHFRAVLSVALAWLSVRCGGVRVLSSFSPPSSPYSGKQGLLLNSFSSELTVQCDGCLIWGLGWRAEIVAGLRVGQAYGVSHRPGFGLLGSVPRSLSTQPPFATQALMVQIFLCPWTQ